MDWMEKNWEFITNRVKGFLLHKMTSFLLEWCTNSVLSYMWYLLFDSGLNIGYMHELGQRYKHLLK